MLGMEDLQYLKNSSAPAHLYAPLHLIYMPPHSKVDISYFLAFFVNYHLYMVYKTTHCFVLPSFEVDTHVLSAITSFTQYHVLRFFHIDVHLQFINLHSCVVFCCKNIKLHMHSLQFGTTTVW